MTNGAPTRVEQQVQASVLAREILTFVQKGKNAEAAELAMQNIAAAAEHGRLAQIAMLAFARHGARDAATSLAEKVMNKPDLESDVALPVAQHLLETGRSKDALHLAQSALGRAPTALPRLNLVAAQAALQEGGDVAVALGYLDEVISKVEQDLPFLRTYGELLLIAGRNREAVDVLSRAAALAPKIANVQVLFSRALKQAHRYEEACAVMQVAVSIDPSPAMRRLATAALLQAGDEGAAEKLYTTMIAERKARLKPTFAEEIEALKERAVAVKIPPQRLEWAWQIAARRLGHDPSTDRADWELRAKWGHLMDQALMDWLECSTNSASEILHYFDDLEPASKVLLEAHAKGKGVLLASAHIGLMFAGPVALHAIGKPYRWVASTPRITTTTFANALISTSDLSEAQVARRVIDALKGGYGVTLAVDGAMSPSAPRIEWEGRSVTYSDFTSMLSFRLGTPTVFVSPYWHEGRIHFVANALPTARPEESPNEFTARWRAAFFDEVRDQFVRGPENLRLNGGIWRDV